MSLSINHHLLSTPTTMQKVLRRTALAERQALCRAKVRKSKYDSEKRTLDLQEAIVHRRLINQNLKNARITRREDWQLGPLAPKRDVGAQKDTYGTSNSRMLRGLDLPESERTKTWVLAEEDRVVILEGRDKGRIGVVKSINKETDQLTVEGLNMVRWAFACAALSHG